MVLIVSIIAVIITLGLGALAIGRVRIARERRNIARSRVRSRRNQAYTYAWNIVRRRKRQLRIEYRETGE